MFVWGWQKTFIQEEDHNREHVKEQWSVSTTDKDLPCNYVELRENDDKTLKQEETFSI